MKLKYYISLVFAELKYVLNQMINVMTVYIEMNIYKIEIIYEYINIYIIVIKNMKMKEI